MERDDKKNREPRTEGKTGPRNETILSYPLGYLFILNLKENQERESERERYVWLRLSEPQILLRWKEMERDRKGLMFDTRQPDQPTDMALDLLNQGWQPDPVKQQIIKHNTTKAATFILTKGPVRSGSSSSSASSCLNLLKTFGPLPRERADMTYICFVF